MGTTRKTITITDQQDNWIKAQIATGEFTNDSEYIRDLIRRDQTSNADIEAVWLYSLSEWGTQQTDCYIDDLAAAFAFLAG